MNARSTIASAALAATAILLSVVPSSASDGFVTDRPPQLTALADGVVIEPILSAGDTVGDYQATGVMDGLGAYRSSPDTIEVFMNHELGGSDPTFARVSHLTLSDEGEVLAASYPIDGTEGYKWFCSATLSMIDGHPWFTTGEEDADPGRAIALDAVTGEVHELPWMGLFSHENVVPMTQLGSKPIMVMLTEDGYAPRSQQYAYVADSWDDVLAGRGRLYVWAPTGGTDRNPSPDDIEKAQTLPGRFVPVPSAAIATADGLEAAAQDLGAFDFMRGEDGTEVPGQPGVFYLADTGTNGKQDDDGRIYRFDVDPQNPLQASLRVVLDSDVDPIMNPDNLGASRTTLVIQEDHNWENRKKDYSNVWSYRFSDGALEKVARVNVPDKLAQTAGGGYWESSGVIDVSAFFGPETWLLTVQAHSAPSVPQPGFDLVPDSDSGEDAQLLLVTIPGS